MSKTKYKSYLLTVIAILSFSTILPAFVYAAPRDVSGEDWVHVNGNSWAQNYSPQDQINRDNVDALEVKWIFPVGSKSLAPSSISALNLAEGASAPPIVRDGIVYIVTNWMRTYAIDAAAGKQLWTHNYNIDIDEIEERLPWSQGGILHLHGFRYWEAGDAILQHGMACDFYGIDAKTGEESFWIKDLCADIEGNIYDYRPSPSNSATIGTYDAGRQFIVVIPGRMHSTLFGGDSRHVTLGIDMDSQEVIWKVYSMPPYDQLSKDWALEECDVGFFHVYSCSDVAEVNREGLEWDFALPGEPPSMYGGVTANWGQMVVDEDTGMVYTQTGNQGPYSNMTLVPGPRLYGSTIMAIDMNQGQRAWWLQPFPHDPYDFDCNWSGFLAESPILGKVYVKGCKEGVYYVMDADTGEPKYARDVMDDMAERGQISTYCTFEDPNPPAICNAPGQQKTKYYRPDPFSYHDMREWNWISWPAANPGEPGERFTLPVTILPSFYNGLFVTDMSYDPETDTLYNFEAASPVSINSERPYIEGGSLFSVSLGSNTNETIAARDLATGDVKWTYYHDVSQSRAALVVSGGMVFTGFTDGFMRFLDKDTGDLLDTVNMGGPIVVQPSIGMDSDGNSKIFVIVGATRLAGVGQFGLSGQEVVPGTLIALGLSDRAQGQITTTVTTTRTTTSTTTSVSTSTSTSTTTSTSTSTTTATVTSTSTSATTRTVTSTTTSATTSTVTSTGQASTTTVTSEVTEETGLPAEVTYAAIAVAVIAIIAAAVLTMRKR
jgi:outer membrane protein assembly factor BamB